LKSAVGSLEIGGSKIEDVYPKMRFLDRGSLQDLLSLEAVTAENLPSLEIFLLHDEDFSERQSAYPTTPSPSSPR
jgi:hypothetical protein